MTAELCARRREYLILDAGEGRCRIDRLARSAEGISRFLESSACDGEEERYGKDFPEHAARRVAFPGDQSQVASLKTSRMTSSPRRHLNPVR